MTAIATVERRSSFTAQRTTDQKRLARGEHLLAARAALRVRDRVHHRPWSVLFTAGLNPAEEIAEIRQLMPKAIVTAIDTDEECIRAAIDAGADDVIHGDIADVFRQGKRFDLVDADLCSSVCDRTRRVLGEARRLVAPKGVFMATFSYGRDVAEVGIARLRALRLGAGGKSSTRERWDCLLEQWGRTDIPDALLGRICYCFGGVRDMESLHSVIAYRGNEMPMCATLFVHLRTVRCRSFVALGNGDYELAAACQDTAPLYATPAERVNELRRSFAAIKAWYTRTQRGRESEKEKRA